MAMIDVLIKSIQNVIEHNNNVLKNDGTDYWFIAFWSRCLAFPLFGQEV